MNFYTNVRQYGKNILYRGIENGKHVARKVAYRPTFFVPSKKEVTKHHTLAGENVEPIEPGDINDAREFLDRYKNVETFPIYGMNKYDYAYISDEFRDDILWDKSLINICYIDIEVMSNNGFPEPEVAAEEVTAITMMMGGVYYSFGCKDYTPHREDIIYTKCVNEKDMLRKFIGHWTFNYPDIISGWNCKFFDIPYLINRMIRVLGEKEANLISPWKKFKSRETFFMNRKQTSYDIFGISTLDYSDLFKKYSKVASQESYRLDHIAFVELGENKLDYSEEFDTLHQLYTGDFQQYMQYNIRDVELVYRMEEFGLYSSKLIELALTLAYDNKVNYDDVFTQVRMWDAIIFNHLRRKNIVIPQMTFGDKETSYTGAFVKPPTPGGYNWVVSFDLNSLYPHLIMQYNLSPETLVAPEFFTDDMWKILGEVGIESLLEKKVELEPLKSLNITVTPNRQFFNINKRGFLAEIMDDMYVGRTVYKKKAIAAKKKLQKVGKLSKEHDDLQREVTRYNNLQLAKKVSLNSAYGAIGNQYFRFFDIRIAEAITMSGQLSYKWIDKKINEYLNNLLKTEDVDYVIAGDTDSMYLNLEPLVQKVYGVDGKVSGDKKKIIGFLDRVCQQKLQPYIDECYQELADYTNAYEQKMQMKRESLCDRAIWTAKKRYILNIWDEEGVEYAEPKIKIVGLEAIKTSTPQVCRSKIKECIKIMLDKDEDAVIDFVETFRDEFRKLPIEDISFPRGVNNLAEYESEGDMYKKHTPIHVKGSLLFNRLLKEHKLTKRYARIQGGEKIKFCYLKDRNPFRNNSIAFINTLPKELGIHDFIDHEIQFEKSFLEPMKTILACINWQAERVSSLESFFS